MLEWVLITLAVVYAICYLFTVGMCVLAGGQNGGVPWIKCLWWAPCLIAGWVWEEIRDCWRKS